MAEVDRLHESGELEDYFAARRRAYQERYRAEGMAQGIERGIERGLCAERDLLCRQADRKFDARKAARIAGLLADIGDAEGSDAGGRLDHRLRHGRGTDRTSCERAAARLLTCRKQQNPV